MIDLPLTKPKHIFFRITKSRKTKKKDKKEEMAENNIDKATPSVYFGQMLFWKAPANSKFHLRVQRACLLSTGHVNSRNLNCLYNCFGQLQGTFQKQQLQFSWKTTTDIRSPITQFDREKKQKQTQNKTLFRREWNRWPEFKPERGCLRFISH